MLTEIKDQLNSINSKLEGEYRKIVMQKGRIDFEDENADEIDYHEMLEIDAVDSENGQPFGAYVFGVNDKGIYIEPVRESSKRFIQFSDVSDLNFKIALLEKMDAEIQTPDCVLIGNDIYLIGDKTNKEFDFIGDDMSYQHAYELQNISREIESNQNDCPSIYVSDVNVFPKATFKQRLQVKEWFEKLNKR